MIIAISLPIASTPSEMGRSGREANAVGDRDACAQRLAEAQKALTNAESKLLRGAVRRRDEKIVKLRDRLRTNARDIRALKVQVNTLQRAQVDTLQLRHSRASNPKNMDVDQEPALAIADAESALASPTSPADDDHCEELAMSDADEEYYPKDDEEDYAEEDLVGPHCYTTEQGWVKRENIVPHVCASEDCSCLTPLQWESWD